MIHEPTSGQISLISLRHLCLGRARSLAFGPLSTYDRAIDLKYRERERMRRRVSIARILGRSTTRRVDLANMQQEIFCFVTHTHLAVSSVSHSRPDAHRCCSYHRKPSHCPLPSRAIDKRHKSHFHHTRYRDHLHFSLLLGFCRDIGSTMRRKWHRRSDFTFITQFHCTIKISSPRVPR